MSSINAIFACESRGGLGFNGSLPWPHNPEDLKWFKEHTDGQIVIMGRRTWDDPKMPKPLPNRLNFIFTNRFINMQNVFCLTGDPQKQVLKVQKEFPNKNIFIIGGKEILEATRPLVDNLYLTNVHGQYKIDVKLELRAYLRGFRLISVTPGEKAMFNIYKNEDPFTV
jgi:dihydrofolate reductase